MADDKKKSIFSNLVDALTNRDEKVAAEKAAAEAAASAELAAKEIEARKEAAEEKRAELAAKVAAEKEAKEKAVKEAAEEANREAARKKAEAEAAIRARAEEQQKRLAEEAAKRAEAAKPKFIAEHKISPDETLSHLALKYYGHATRDYWMLIYEANKETIGGNPNIVRVGTVLNIPELPEELKK